MSATRQKFLQLAKKMSDFDDNTESQISHSCLSAGDVVCQVGKPLTPAAEGDIAFIRALSMNGASSCSYRRAMFDKPLLAALSDLGAMDKNSSQLGQIGKRHESLISNPGL